MSVTDTQFKPNNSFDVVLHLLYFSPEHSLHRSIPCKQHMHSDCPKRTFHSCSVGKKYHMKVGD